MMGFDAGLLVELVILSFAAFRLTQFFVFDSLWGGNPHSGSKRSARIDKFAYNQEDGSDRSFLRGKYGDLMSCPWCIGFWISAATFTAYAVSAGQWGDYSLVMNVLLMFAVAGGQGLLNSLRD